ncbi:MAG: hypothetical protein A2V98_04805 [Planctomycetes bacterium RBG_16_64_12]|nr:MAG: hypothetical protein A2V98_04805 [Planctomycetes bacterium RBG_16_64_12]
MAPKPVFAVTYQLHGAPHRIVSTSALDLTTSIFSLEHEHPDARGEIWRFDAQSISPEQLARDAKAEAAEIGKAVIA